MGKEKKKLEQVSKAPMGKKTKKKRQVSIAPMGQKVRERGGTQQVSEAPMG